MVSFEEFVLRANKIHMQKYIYDESSFKSMTEKMLIFCPYHASFWQLPSGHLGGKGCPRCKAEKLSEKFLRSQEEFARIAQEVHQNLYDYSKAKYIGARRKLEIICKIHGSFWQLPTNHISKARGCPKCKGGVLDTKESFIRKAKEKHGNQFDYRLVNYINTMTNVSIECPKHGVYSQKPFQHLQSKFGCKFCYLQSLDDGVSKISQEWLDSFSIPSLIREYEIFIKDERFVLDAFDPITNTVYEYCGMFWHGHPSKYESDNIHPVTKKTFGEMYKKTIDRQQKIVAAGYRLILKWGP